MSSIMTRRVAWMSKQRVQRKVCYVCHALANELCLQKKCSRQSGVQCPLKCFR